MSEEQNDKSRVEQNADRLSESSNTTENEQHTSDTSKRKHQNSSAKSYRSQEKKLNENSKQITNECGISSSGNFPECSKAGSSCFQNKPSLSKWMASNVQSITKLITEDNKSNRSSLSRMKQVPSKILVLSASTYRNIKDTASTVSHLIDAALGTLPKTNKQADASPKASQRQTNVSGRPYSNYTQDAQNVQFNNFQHTELENNRPSCSHYERTLSPAQLPETFISSQELYLVQPQVQEESTDLIIPNVEDIINRAFRLSLDHERTQSTYPSQVITTAPTRSSEAVGCSEYPHHSADSTFEVLISPLPYPPRVVHGPPSILGAPPSYSAVMRLGDDPDWGRRIGVRPSPPFIAPTPPPAYTTALGYTTERNRLSTGIDDDESYSDWIRYTLDQMVWGPEPITMFCPRCANIIVTTTHARRSGLSHITAVIMFFCGCWPCCLLPYCMDSCKNTYHYCPRCEAFLGVYRPW